MSPVFHSSIPVHHSSPLFIHSPKHVLAGSPEVTGSLQWREVPEQGDGEDGKETDSHENSTVDQRGAEGVVAGFSQSKVYYGVQLCVCMCVCVMCVCVCEREVIRTVSEHTTAYNTIPGPWCRSCTQ